MSKPLCYGYIRWSSDRQSDGTTYERQLATATRVARENQLELVKLIDDGVSAYKGRNAEDGALGQFIDGLRNKTIVNNCWLVVENLDCLSRQSPITDLHE